MGSGSYGDLDATQNLDFDQDVFSESESSSSSDMDAVQEAYSESDSNTNVEMSVDNSVDADGTPDMNVNEVNEVINDNDVYLEENNTCYEKYYDLGGQDSIPSQDPTPVDTSGLTDASEGSDYQIVAGPEEDPYMVLDAQSGQLDVLVGGDLTTIQLDQSEVSQLLDLLNWLNENAPSDLLDLLYQLLAYLFDVFHGLLSPDTILDILQQVAEYTLSGDLDVDMIGHLVEVLETASSPLYAAMELAKTFADLGLCLDVLDGLLGLL